MDSMQVLINSLNSANSVEELRNRLIPLLTVVAQAGPFASGTWTPTFSTFTNAITDATLISATYQRVGNVVTCSITLSIEVDFSSDNNGSFNFTLPFSTTTGGACGSLSSSNITQQFNGAVRPSGTTQGRIVMGSEDALLVVPSATCHAVFQYEIN